MVRNLFHIKPCENCADFKKSKGIVFALVSLLLIALLINAMTEVFLLDLLNIKFLSKNKTEAALIFVLFFDVTLALICLGFVLKIKAGQMWFGKKRKPQNNLAHEFAKLEHRLNGLEKNIASARKRLFGIPIGRLPHQAKGGHATIIDLDNRRFSFPKKPQRRAPHKEFFPFRPSHS